MQVAGADSQREPRLVTDALDVLELDSGRPAGAAHDRIGGLLACSVELALTGGLFLDTRHRAIDVGARHAAGDRAEVRRGAIGTFVDVGHFHLDVQALGFVIVLPAVTAGSSEEQTSVLQSLMRISYT